MGLLSFACGCRVATTRRHISSSKSAGAARTPRLRLRSELNRPGFPVASTSTCASRARSRTVSGRARARCSPARGGTRRCSTCPASRSTPRARPPVRSTGARGGPRCVAGAIRRIRSELEQRRAVVRLEQDRVARREEVDDGRRDRSDVRQEAERVVLRLDRERDVRRVVRERDRANAKPADLERLTRAITAHAEAVANARDDRRRRAGGPSVAPRPPSARGAPCTSGSSCAA